MRTTVTRSETLPLIHLASRAVWELFAMVNVELETSS